MESGSLILSMTSVSTTGTVSYGKPENPVIFIFVETSHKGVTQINLMNYIQIII